MLSFEMLKIISNLMHSSQLNLMKVHSPSSRVVFFLNFRKVQYIESVKESLSSLLTCNALIKLRITFDYEENFLLYDTGKVGHIITMNFVLVVC